MQPRNGLIILHLTDNPGLHLQRDYMSPIPSTIYEHIIQILWKVVLYQCRFHWSNQATSHTLHWRHNGHDCVSNHQPQDCLLDLFFRRRSKRTPKLRVTGLCAGNSPGPVNSPHKWPLTRKMFPFDNVIMSNTAVVGVFKMFCTWGAACISSSLCEICPRASIPFVKCNICYSVILPAYFYTQYKCFTDKIKINIKNDWVLFDFTFLLFVSVSTAKCLYRWKVTYL